MTARHAFRHGYSLIEVMTAVAIMIVGATGLVLMQGATARGNLQAQQTTVAVLVATNWVERLKRESSGWSSPSTGWPDNPVLTPNLITPAGQAYAPVATLVGANESAWSDGNGFDTTNPAQARFFVRMRNHALHTTTTGIVDAIRVDITVYWFRSVYGANDADVANRNPAGYDPPSVGVVPSDPLIESSLTNEVYASVVVKAGGP